MRHLIFPLADALRVLERGEPWGTIPVQLTQKWEDLDDEIRQTHLGLDIEREKVIELEHAEAADRLTLLLQEAPLANASLQLLMDHFFTDLEEGSPLYKAIAGIFPDSEFPERSPHADLSDGALTHPMLEHVQGRPLAELARNVMACLLAEGGTSPLNSIPLGKMMGHSPAVLNGDILCLLVGGQGVILMPDILYQAFRIEGHDGTKPNDENRIEMGREAAKAIAFETDADIVQAFTRADAFQARLCRDMHAVLTLTRGKKCPKWVQNDMFHVLEREAMKQVFAERLYDRLDSLSGAMAHVIRIAAEGDIHPSLQKAANEILNNAELYTGTLLTFASEAEARHQ